MVDRPRLAPRIYTSTLAVERIRAHWDWSAATVVDWVHGIRSALVAVDAAAWPGPAFATALAVRAGAVSVVRILLNALGVVRRHVGALEAAWAALLILWPWLPICNNGEPKTKNGSRRNPAVH